MLHFFAILFITIGVMGVFQGTIMILDGVFYKKKNTIPYGLGILVLSSILVLWSYVMYEKLNWSIGA